MNEKQEKRLNIAKEYATSKGGTCLSEEYVNSKTKLTWKCCNPNHEKWEALFDNIINKKSWCPNCAGKFSKEEGLSRAKYYAESKGGKCLSEEYTLAKNNLIWKCANPDHKPWKATYSKVVNTGRWCPQCAVYYYKEDKIRSILEYLLDVEFLKVRPKWNINPRTNLPLELDGYNELLKIAFEFQGLHHYKIGHFSNSDYELEDIKYKDEIKKENCKKQNIKLIIIDDKFPLTKKNEIVNYIVEILKINNIKILKKINQDDINNIFKKLVNHQDNYLKKARDYAAAKDGFCLSNQYFSAREKLIWKCSNPKHESWEATYDSVRRGSWCLKCAKEKRKK